MKKLNSSTQRAEYEHSGSQRLMKLTGKKIVSLSPNKNQLSRYQQHSNYLPRDYELPELIEKPFAIIPNYRFEDKVIVPLGETLNSKTKKQKLKVTQIPTVSPFSQGY